MTENTALNPKLIERASDEIEAVLDACGAQNFQALKRFIRRQIIGVNKENEEQVAEEAIALMIKAGRLFKFEECGEDTFYDTKSDQ